MASNTLIRLVCTVALIVCLGTSGVLASVMSATAGRAQLTYADQSTEGDPPEVALGVAMGAFRGLFVNYLWLRATRLKEEGKFHEAIELSNAITRLQPRFPRVWAFHAWNMSYNISVATNTREERWQWVDAGINILRTEGIPRNPNEVHLYRELAWIFIHKVQGYQDDANRYYKRRIADRWHTVLGEPPNLPERDTEAATQLMVEWLDPIVRAPATLEGVIDEELQELGRARDLDGPAPAEESRVRELAERIEQAGLELDIDLLKLTSVSFALREQSREMLESLEGLPEELRAALEGELVDRSLLNEAIDGLVNDERYDAAWDRLLPFIRKRVLIDEFNMSPSFMQQYTERYGPLDWRHPASHAIYWAALGVERGLQRYSVKNFDTLNTDRIIVHALQELFRSGDIYHDILASGERAYFTMYNTHFADAYGEVLESLMERGGRSQDVNQRVYTTYGQGYYNFLADAVRVFYQMGDRERADEFFTELRTFEFRNLNDYMEWFETSMPLDQFVPYMITEEERYTIPHVAATEVTASLRMALVKGLLEGDREAFEGNMRYARQVHEAYYNFQDVGTLVDPDFNRMDEMPVGFARNLGDVFFSMLTSGSLSFPDSARLYDRAPIQLQQLVYDGLNRWMTRLGIAPELREEFFPEPPGMRGFRAAERTAVDAFQRDRKATLRFERR